eukprot:gene57465-78742_t
MDPSLGPTSQPFRQPSYQPSCQPYKQPSGHPSFQPSSRPSVTTFDFTVSMTVVNIAILEISNITFSNAFCAAVAQSMRTERSYVAFQSYSPWQRRLMSASSALGL